MVKKLVVSPQPCDARKKRLQMSTKIGFSNETGRTVSVIKRDGTVSVIPATLTSTRHGGNFEIIYSVSANPEVLETMRCSNELSSAQLGILNDIEQRGSFNGHEYSVSYTIPSLELFDMEGVYLENLDYVITTRPLEYLPKHPYSVSRGMDLVAGTGVENILTYRLTVVNKFQTRGDMYVNLCGAAVKVPRTYFDDMPDGIYVSYNDGRFATSKYFDFDDPNKPFNLYQTPYEAETVGGELSTAMNKLKKEEKEFFEYKRKWEMEQDDLKLRREAEMSALELDKQMLTHTLTEKERTLEHYRKTSESQQKIEETVVKSRADEQSTVRKNTTEWIKVVPHILGTISLAAAMYR